MKKKNVKLCGPDQVPRHPLKPWSKAWMKEAIDDHTNGIESCALCGGPVRKGYCCTHCGNDEY